jgi:hypothetical protein
MQHIKDNQRPGSRNATEYAYLLNGFTDKEFYAAGIVIKDGSVNLFLTEQTPPQVAPQDLRVAPAITALGSEPLTPINRTAEFGFYTIQQGLSTNNGEPGKTKIEPLIHIPCDVQVALKADGDGYVHISVSTIDESLTLDEPDFAPKFWQ